MISAMSHPRLSLTHACTPRTRCILCLRMSHARPPSLLRPPSIAPHSLAHRYPPRLPTHHTTTRPRIILHRLRLARTTLPRSLTQPLTIAPASCARRTLARNGLFFPSRFLTFFLTLIRTRARTHAGVTSRDTVPPLLSLTCRVVVIIHPLCDRSCSFLLCTRVCLFTGFKFRVRRVLLPQPNSSIVMRCFSIIANVSCCAGRSLSKFPCTGPSVCTA
ncbi:hypothetical protein C8Q79DRAFT_1518 [Trametes meyenii]|nr:hypothetical protein C8Q79DRAFT_1518 [Trametes meyenii]